VEEDGNVIVACERCATQFQLDDERVPEDGVRVRCSRCKHAFFIERPARNEVEKIHRIARRALEDGPSASRDLGPAAASDALDEEDWKFADDAPFGSEEPEDTNALTTAAANVVDDLLGGSGARSVSASVVDLIGDDGMPTRSAPPASVDAEDNSVSSGQDSPLEPELDSGLDLADSSSADLRSDFASGDDATDLLAGLRDELGAEDSLEVESGFDLAGDPDPDASSQREPATQPTRQIVIPQESDELGALADWGLADESESPTAAMGLEVPTRATARVPTDVEDEPSARAMWLMRAGNLVGWVGVIALFAFGLHSGVVVNANPQPAPVGAVRVGGFALSHVESTWVDNFHVGPLLVVSGTLRNEAARRGTGVEATWLGIDGEPIGDTGLSVGPALGEALLRSSHPDVLAAAQRSLREEGWPWNPGEERRFVAVARTVPPAAAWVRFEAQTNALPVPAPTPVMAPVPAGESDTPAEEPLLPTAAKSDTGLPAPGP